MVTALGVEYTCTCKCIEAVPCRGFEPLTAHLQTALKWPKQIITMEKSGRGIKLGRVGLIWASPTYTPGYNPGLRCANTPL
jgi:hypothetical protein